MKLVRGGIAVIAMAIILSGCITDDTPKAKSKPLNMNKTSFLNQGDPAPFEGILLTQDLMLRVMNRCQDVNDKQEFK